MSDAEATQAEEPLFDAASLCGIPMDHLDTFGLLVPHAAGKQWRALRQQMQVYQTRIKREIAVLREEMERAKRPGRAGTVGRADEARWARLQAKLDEIEASDEPEEAKKAQVARALVGVVDKVEFARSLERGLQKDNAEARKLYAQLAGLIEEKGPQEFAPVFNFRVYRVGEGEPVAERSGERSSSTLSEIER
jgi:hypothetical protein